MSIPRRGFRGLVILAAALFVRSVVISFESGDYRAFLSNWYDVAIARGKCASMGLGANELPGFCYPPLYLYLIGVTTILPIPKLYALKLISVSADFLAALFFSGSCQLFAGGRWTSWLLLSFLLLPTVVLNSAMWGQCDMMYTGALVASLYYILQGRPLAVLVAFGVAFSLKPQAICWCPFLAVLLLSGRIPWKLIWVPAGVYLAVGVPAMLAGRPPMDVLFQWTSAAVDKPKLTMGAPNWYQWLPEGNDPMLFWAGIALTLVAAELFILWLRHGPPKGAHERQWLVSVALLSVLFPPFLLPGMHERYFFAADVISLIYAASVPRGWRVAALVQAASLGSYLPYLFQVEPVPLPVLTVLVLVAMVLVVKGLHGTTPPLPVANSKATLA